MAIVRQQLTQTDFDWLIRGGDLTIKTPHNHTVQICLEDISYYTMQELAEEADGDGENYLGQQREAGSE